MLVGATQTCYGVESLFRSGANKTLKNAKKLGFDDVICSTTLLSKSENMYIVKLCIWTNILKNNTKIILKVTNFSLSFKIRHRYCYLITQTFIFAQNIFNLNIFNQTKIYFRKLKA